MTIRENEIYKQKKRETLMESESLHSSQHKTKVSQKELSACVSMFIKQRKLIKNKHTMKIREMRFISQRKGKHLWNQTTCILQKVGPRHFKRRYYVLPMCVKHEINNIFTCQTRISIFHQSPI